MRSTIVSLALAALALHAPTALFASPGAEPLAPFACPLPAGKCAAHDECLAGKDGKQCYVAGSIAKLTLMRTNPTAADEVTSRYNWRSCKLGHAQACDKLLYSIEQEEAPAGQLAVAKRLCMIFKNWVDDDPAREPQRKAACARYDELKRGPAPATTTTPPPPTTPPPTAVKAAPAKPAATATTGAVADPLAPFPCALPAEKCADHDKCLAGTDGTFCYLTGLRTHMALSSAFRPEDKLKIATEYFRRACALGNVDSCFKVVDYEKDPAVRLAWAERGCKNARERHNDAGKLGSKVDHACGVVQKVKAPRARVVANEDVAATLALVAQRKKNLAGVDLSNKRLAEIDLSSVNLTGANLTGAVLSGANLDGATLEEATLTKASLDRVTLRGGRLARLHAAGTNLAGANLDGSYLEGADLEGADLRGASFEGASLQGTKLGKANLESANLYHADLHLAKLAGASFKWATLTGANLSGVDLTGCNFEHANAAAADFVAAKLDGSNLNDATFSNTKLRRTSLQRVTALRVSFAGAELDKTDFGSARLTGAVFDTHQRLLANFMGAIDPPRQ